LFSEFLPDRIILTSCFFGIFQGCIAVYLSRYCCRLSAATRLLYHEFLALSTTFLNFLRSFFFNCTRKSRVLVYNTKSCRICQQLFVKKIIFLRAFYALFSHSSHNIKQTYLIGLRQISQDSQFCQLFCYSL